MRCPELGRMRCRPLNHTSNTVATHTSHQAINPVRVLLRLADNHGVAFLKDLVYRDQGLERLDLVGEDRLPKGTQISQPSEHFHSLLARYFQYSHFHASPESRRRLVVPCVHDTTPHMFPYRRGGWSVRFGDTHDINWSQWKASEYDANVRFGAVSSINNQLSAHRVHSRIDLVPRSPTYRYLWPCEY